MRKLLCSLIFAILFIFAINSSVHAATYYVAGDTGLDTNDGSEPTPWQTIQKAADTMVAGDTVNVKGGITYTVGQNCSGGGRGVLCIYKSGSSGNFITYRAWSGTGIPIIVTAQDGDSGIYFKPFNGNYVVIDGFDIHVTGPGPQSSGLWLQNAFSNVVIKNNVIHGSGGTDSFGIYDGELLT